MLTKERLLGILLFIACIPAYFVPAYLGLIKSLAEMNTQIVAALIVSMVIGGATLFYHGGRKHPIKEAEWERKKRAFKLAIRKEVQDLVDSISNSRGYKLFHPQEWQAYRPSERRLLLDTDREWELLTDFYGKLQARNDYASLYQSYDPAITKSETMAELDRQCVEAGRKVIKDIEWGR